MTSLIHRATWGIQQGCALVCFGRCFTHLPDDVLKARLVSDLFTFSYRHQKGEEHKATMPIYHSSLYVSAAPTNQAMTKTSTKHQSYEPLNKSNNYGYSSSPKTQEHKEKHVRFYPEVRVRLFPREERWKTKYSTILWSLLIYRPKVNKEYLSYLSDILCMKL